MLLLMPLLTQQPIKAMAVNFSRKTLLISGAIAILAMLLFYLYRKMKASSILSLLNSGSTESNNVKAFLLMIRTCEGTAGANGYNMLFGGKLFTDYSQHPNVKVPFGSTYSTAAGAYQILYGTWLGCQAMVEGLTDFTPPNQDKAAIYLIDRRSALDDVKAGRLQIAISKCSKEWASLPGSPYGQPVKTLAQAQTYYTNAGGVIA